MSKQAAPASSWTSRVLFLGMVAAAGGITWYGIGASQAAPVPAVEATQTLAVLPGQALPEPAPEASGPRTGLPTRLVVEHASIDAPVSGVGVVLREGRPAWETAWTAVGHHLDSALPGQPGNVVFTGHVSVASRESVAYFATLDQVQVGDIVEVFSGATVFRYQVDEIVEVEPDETRVLRSDHRSRVTLITCTRDLQHRLIVSGSLVQA